MSRRQQEGASLRTIYDGEERRRVCFVKNLDQTFGFLEWNFSDREDSWIPTRNGAGSRFATLEDAITDAKGRVPWLARSAQTVAPTPSPSMIYQLGWTTLPGLRGLSVSEFRAAPTNAPDNEKGIAVPFANDADRDAFLRQLEQEFASRRFNNAADAFDIVKGYVLDRVAHR